MSAIASDGIPIEKGQHLRLIPDGTEITVAWVDPDGTVTDTDGDVWDPRDLEHMPPIDERREVARRLRSLNGNIRHVRRVYEAEGLSILCEDQADYYQICYAVAGYLPAEHMHPCDYEELHNRIADLIEPSCDRDTPQKVAEEMFGKMRHSTKGEVDAYDAMLKSKSVELHPVDRDSLLALADELEEDACWEVQSPGVDNCAWRLKDVCDRIREALGVEQIA